MTTVDKLVVQIKADVAQAVAGIAQVKTATESLAKSVNNVGDKFKSVGRSMTHVGKQMGLAVLPFVAGLGLAVKTGADFEQAMKNVQTVSNASSEEFKRLTKFAEKMGETTIFTATEASQALYSLASAGLSVDEQMKSLSAVLDLAAATQASLGESSEIVVSTLNAFNFNARESRRIANVFASAISNTSLNMERLGVAMPYIAGLAHTFGISLEETTATLGLLVSSGIRAESAGRLLASSLQQLLNPTRAARDTLQKYGITLDSINPSVHSITEIVGVFQRANMSAADAVRVFGVEGSRVWLTLNSIGNKAISDMTKNITGTNRAAEMAADQINTFSGAIKILKSGIQGIEISVFNSLRDTITELIEKFREMLPGIKEFAIAFASGVVPVIKTFLKFLGKVVGVFNDLSPRMKKVIGYATGIAVVFGAIAAPALILTGVLLSSIGAIVGFTSSLLAIPVVAAVVGPAITLMTGPIGIVIMAIAAFALAWKVNLFGIRDTTHRVVTWVKDKFTSLVNKFYEFTSQFGIAGSYVRRILLGMLGPIGMVVWAFKNWDKIKSYIGGVIDKIEPLRKIINSINKLLGRHTENIETVTEATKQDNRTRDKATDGIDEQNDAIKQSQSEWRKLQESIEGAADSTDSFGESAGNAIDRLAGLSDFDKKFLQAGNYIDSAGRHITDIKRNMEDIIPTVLLQGKSWADQVKIIEKFRNRVKGLGGDVKAYETAIKESAAYGNRNIPKDGLPPPMRVDTANVKNQLANDYKDIVSKIKIPVIKSPEIPKILKEKTKEVTVKINVVRDVLDKFLSEDITKIVNIKFNLPEIPDIVRKIKYEGITENRLPSLVPTVITKTIKTKVKVIRDELDAFLSENITKNIDIKFNSERMASQITTLIPPMNSLVNGMMALNSTLISQSSLLRSVLAKPTYTTINNYNYGGGSSGGSDEDTAKKVSRAGYKRAGTTSWKPVMF